MQNNNRFKRYVIYTVAFLACSQQLGASEELRDKKDKKTVYLTLAALASCGFGIGVAALIYIKCHLPKNDALRDIKERINQLDEKFAHNIKEENERDAQEELERKKKREEEQAKNEAQYKQKTEENERKTREALQKIDETKKKIKEDELRTYQQIAEEAKSRKYN